MPNPAPFVPSYGKPLDHQQAPPPNFRPTPILENAKSQKPLNSIMKKMMQKMPKGKMRLKPPKNKKLKETKYY